MKRNEPCLCGDPECRQCFAHAPCDRCDDTGLIEYCEMDGGNCYMAACACEAGERKCPAFNPRERGDDDGVEYADPRDAMDERMFGGD